MDGSKFKLSFSKKIEKKVLQPSALRVATVKTQETKKEVIECIEDNLITSHDDESKELVIPHIHVDRVAAFKAKSRNVPSVRVQSEPTKEQSEEPAPQLTLDQLAENALLEEARDGVARVAADSNSSIAMQEQLTDASPKSAQPATLDDYDEVQIDCFGAALLRGLGWKKNEGVGNIKMRRVVSVIEATNKTMEMSAPTSGSSGQQSANRQHGESEESLPLVKGCHIYIHAGRSKATYGVVESIEDDYLLVRRALGGDSVVREVVANVRVVTAKHYKDSSRVINKEMYDTFKAAQTKKKNEKSKKRRRRSSDDDSSEEETHDKCFEFLHPGDVKSSAGAKSKVKPDVDERVSSYDTEQAPDGKEEQKSSQSSSSKQNNPHDRLNYNGTTIEQNVNLNVKTTSETETIEDVKSESHSQSPQSNDINSINSKTRSNHDNDRRKEENVKYDSKDKYNDESYSSGLKSSKNGESPDTRNDDKGRAKKSQKLSVSPTRDEGRDSRNDDIRTDHIMTVDLDRSVDADDRTSSRKDSKSSGDNRTSRDDNRTGRYDIKNSNDGNRTSRDDDRTNRDDDRTSRDDSRTNRDDSRINRDYSRTNIDDKRSNRDDIRSNKDHRRVDKNDRRDNRDVERDRRGNGGTRRDSRDTSFEKDDYSNSTHGNNKNKRDWHREDERTYTTAQKLASKYGDCSNSRQVAPWVREGLTVRIVSEKYKSGKYFKEKVVVLSVLTAVQCSCRTDKGKLLSAVPIDCLETVIPKLSPRTVLVLRGGHAGQAGVILEQHKQEQQASLQLRSEPSVILRLNYEDICQYDESMS